ncbi:4'-phosphopantetheinyl transferase [Clavibacter michiganensis]|uniref:4'-phosphopantetheinyl transferase family protein n=1 Tax=Clavibacter michiganensis TaxID=28447 RepID=UPI0019580073|nr:4'-phosphopantetheinyl transferase superfamily protein [Clavibacter michiganensis]MBM7411138.1 4'-phosphopantetheinyl transferase [Clavibacter michiganensis]
MCDAHHREDDRRASALAFALLQRMWEERNGTSAMPAVERGRYGKPRLPGAAGFEFNLSHDRQACVCAVASGPVGVDVQSRVPFDGALFERIAAEGERALGERLRRLDDLAWLWSRKEAVVKRCGRGLTAPLRSIDTLAESDLVSFGVEGVDAVISVSVGDASDRGLLRDLRVRLLEPVLGTDGDPAPLLWRQTALVPVPTPV